MSLSSWRDYLNFVALLKIRTALGLKHIEVKKDWWLSDGVEMPVYRLATLEIQLMWQRRLYNGDDPPGRWADKDANGAVIARGEDIFSLLKYLRSAEFLERAMRIGDLKLMQAATSLFDPDASDERSMSLIEERLGIERGMPTINQANQRPDWEQDRFAFSSTPPLEDHDVRQTGAWPDANPLRLPVMGYPHRRYKFFDPEGRLQMYIGEWLIEGHPSLWIAFTPWHPAADPPNQKWLPHRTSLPIAPYGRDVAQRNPDATIVILDDVRLAEDLNMGLEADPPVVFVAWPRVVDGTSPSDTDWTELRGRNALIIVYDDRKSAEHGIELVKLLEASPVARVSVRLDPPHPLHSPALFEGTQAVDQFLKVAHQRYRLDADTLQRLDRNVWKPGMPILDGLAGFLLKPFVIKRGITLLVGRSGRGKTWLEALIGCSLASGIPLLDFMEVESPMKVLFLRSEATDGLKRKMDKIVQQFSLGNAIENMKVHPEVIGDPVNLESEEAWDQLDDLISWADVVLVDHLTKFTNGSGPENWRRVENNAKRRTANGKSFLMLHHTNKKGEQRGSERIGDDVDLNIKMEDLPEGSAPNGTRISFRKARDDEGLGRDLQPFDLYWDQDEKTDPIKWWIEAVENDERGAWRKAPHTASLPKATLNQRYLARNFHDDELTVMRLLADAYIRGTSSLPRRSFQAALKISSSGTRNVLAPLVENGKIEREVRGKATVYWLAPAEVRNIFGDQSASKPPPSL